LLERGVAVPYCLPLPTEDTNWKVSFERPSEILLVGSWANKTCVKGKDGTKFGVDLAVEMPQVSGAFLTGMWLHTPQLDSVSRERLSE
jgi:U3 small nucleolar RNA-associated protein 22